MRLTDKLGTILVKSGVITDDQVKKALEVQKGTNKRLGEILIDLGLVSEMDVASALSKQLGVPYVTLDSGLLKPPKGQGLEELVPEEFSRQYRVLPLSRNLNALTVACLNPLDIITMDNLNRLTGCEISPVVATRPDLDQAIDVFYGEGSMLQEAVEKSYQIVDDDDKVDRQQDQEVVDLDRLKQAAQEAPVIRLVDLVVRQAIKQRASDIHIEPFKDTIKLRYRIDGMLYEIAPPAKALHAAIVSRIKILCKLDIAEKRLPQDGAFSMTLEKQAIDFRVSTIPTLYGEKVVIRILRKSPELLQIKQLGFTKNEQQAFEDAITRPYGMILITGPTGSGKTTTLYAALNMIRSASKNLMTVEDPVEYRLDGVNQVQVKPSIGLTFAAGLRAFLRQDPDVIMVGEIRDQETAEIAMRAAMTGHLVFSTLHTNNAPTAITRLIDAGIPPFLAASTVTLVCAQRLIRRLCENCREAYEPSPELRKQFSIKEELLYKSKGCDKCSESGYRGRIGIYEVMPMTTELRNLAGKSAPSHELAAVAKQQGVASLWDAGLEKVRQGVTSLEEIESVIVLEKV